jgi:biopolymer transport protein ExbD
MPNLQEGTVNVTPLIDIVMCMIVFFMLVAKIGVDTGADPEIDVPVTQLGADEKEIGVGSAVVLNVREVGGQPLVTGVVESAGAAIRTGQVVEIKVFDPVTNKRPLLETLKQLRYGRDARPGGTDANADNPEFKVIIRGEKSMTYATLEPILRACMEANVKNVNFNTKKAT